MTKFRKILLICVSALVLMFAAAIQLTIGWRPFLGPRKRALTNRTFAATPERLARGRYLTQGLLGCETCHSPRDWTQHGAPLLPGKELAGQQFEVPGFPGHFVAPNLTPDRETGAGTWTDDQIARAIREGIKHDDTTLFPIMPYTQYRNLSDEDLASVVCTCARCRRCAIPYRRCRWTSRSICWCAAFPSRSPGRCMAPTLPIRSPAANTWQPWDAAATMPSITCRSPEARSWSGPGAT